MPGAGEQTKEELEALKLKAAADAAAKKANGEEDESDPADADADKGDDADNFSDPVKAKAAVQALRSEAAKHRKQKKASDDALVAANAKIASFKKALGVEDKEDPEEKVKTLQSENDALQMEISLSKISREHNIPSEHDKYFRFLLAEQMEALEDGETISDEQIDEIAKQIAKLSGKQSNSTGLDATGKKKPAGGNDSVTVDAFAKMNSGEKSELYAKNPGEYNRLFAEAKSKRLI